jgi:putative acyl-CoA dehydrogenase
MLIDEPVSAAPESVIREVLNQPPPLQDYNAFEQDIVLRDGLRREGAAWAEPAVRAFGADIGSARVIEWGFQANQNTPVLKTHDRFGHRIDEVKFHPAWHDLMRLGVEAKIPSWPWREPRPGAHVARIALHYLLTQAEAGVCCPLTMTFAVVPALTAQPEVAEEWIPRVISDRYDPRFVPADQKAGCIMGMAMTERQGGSDVRANTTRAVALGKGGPGEEYHLYGHKWFCSAPMCDAFLTLAQTDKGVSCFFLPRWKPDGTLNAFEIARLKDKLGNRSNASSEPEFRGAWARMVGEEGRGVPTIIEMVGHTRLDCVSGSAALMRQALAQATHHAAYRSAFGKKLIDQPLMLNVLADLAIEVEAATLTALRLARAFDDSRVNESARPFARIATAAGKYWVCKRAPEFTYEAMECLGGNGYVEDSIMPRLYRETPVNAIWEGSGNVIALDILRAMAKEPETVPAFLGELDAAQGADQRLDAYIGKLKEEFANRADLEIRARRLTERLALALQGSLMVRHADPAAADAFCASRLAGNGGHVYGTLPAGLDCRRIVERARPKIG